MGAAVDQILFSQKFYDQARLLPKHVQEQVWLDVHNDLAANPRPDGHHKKVLNGRSGSNRLFRYRIGDYRVLYTFGNPRGYVKLRAVVKRDDHTYTNLLDPDADEWGDLPPTPDEVDLESLLPSTQHTVAASSNPHTSTAQALPKLLGSDELRTLGIPDNLIDEICRCKTEDELLQANVPSDLLIRVIDVVLGAETVERPNEPQYLAPSREELPGFLTGELAELMLHLDDTQRRYAEWPASGNGPSLVKGCPGSGKSAVAAYRVKSLVPMLRDQGTANPEILVTSFTNSLVNSLRLLITRLARHDARCVIVSTADQCVKTVLEASAVAYHLASDSDGVARAATMHGRTLLVDSGSTDDGISRAIDRLTLDYLTEEIERFIVGRNVNSLDDYLRANRAGRRVGLTQQQRKTVWRVYQGYEAYLQNRNLMTFAQTRRLAMQLVESGTYHKKFDAVVIDEAQDLDPTVIRMLIGLCRSTDRLFLTADAAQQVYGCGFAWREIHEDLNLRGRVGTLINCYRSTSEIGSAAGAWFTDPDRDKVVYQRHGPLPLCKTVTNHAEAASAICAYVRAATRMLHVPIGSCAVLVPTNDVAKSLAHLLRKVGVSAEWTPSNQFQLHSQSVKVLTYHTAKGLEFPIVAMYDYAPTGGSASTIPLEEREEQDALDRRVRFVAMTRAMQTLTLVRRSEDGSLPKGLDGSEWLHHWPDDLEAWCVSSAEQSATH